MELGHSTTRREEASEKEPKEPLGIPKEH